MERGKKWRVSVTSASRAVKNAMTSFFGGKILREREREKNSNSKQRPATVHHHMRLGQDVGNGPHTRRHTSGVKSSRWHPQINNKKSPHEARVEEERQSPVATDLNAASPSASQSPMGGLGKMARGSEGTHALTSV